MVLQNSGRYKPEKGNPFSAGTSTGVGGSETGEDGNDLRYRIIKENEAIDVKYGFDRINEQFGREITGYLMNIHSAEMLDENKRLIAYTLYTNIFKKKLLLLEKIVYFSLIECIHQHQPS